MTSRFAQFFATTLADRIGKHQHIETAEDVSDWLVDSLGLDLDEADSLAHGEEINWDPELEELICKELSYDRRLLRLLINPTSSEVFKHTLVEVMHDKGQEDGECLECQEIALGISQVQQLDEESLLNLAYLMFEHLPSNYQDQAPHSGVIFTQIRSIFFSLSPQGQCLILATAMEQQDKESLGHYNSPIMALQTWRAEHLPAAAQKAVDILAEHEEGILPGSELLAQAGWEGESVVDRFLHVLSSSIAQYNELHPAQQLMLPIETINLPRVAGSFLRLRSNYLLPLRSLIRTERLLTRPSVENHTLDD